MFIKIRKRRNKNETVYYFYKTQNTRIDKKVITKQEYLLKLRESQIFYADRLMDSAITVIRKNDFNTWLKLITKIQFEILKEKQEKLYK
ncbi:hypothetical protein [Clostridium botulinum]|uniref:hypothetical protein n=1 Tax=Clostridium botulinum TaxID=1491 RepID=UPI001C9AAB40|nr:hypothetical protein [Clostridium botulinum]MBY6809012.1 hypothetical protein [Clostridium botulinum]MBY6822283.1 hypothetical protein [Clostridium botulinum]MBY6832927.1 hypothetical protein [Clostridium botulinum]MBY6972155.1 hypothetical protein [Clostridium botulinum]HBJ1649390.1 hypothetical protein [Clostridium botulinum]